MTEELTRSKRVAIAEGACQTGLSKRVKILSACKKHFNSNVIKIFLAHYLNIFRLHFSGCHYWTVPLRSALLSFGRPGGTDPYIYEDEDGGHEGRLVGGHLYEDLDEDDVHGVCLVEPGLGLHVPDIDENMETLTSA